MKRRINGKTLWLCEGVELERVLEALESPGVTLKESSKSVTRRVGAWVVKASRFEGGLGIIKHTLFRNRYRRAWRAANHLKAHNVLVPTPIAYVERGCLGVITGNVYVSEYLDGFVNVEHFAARLHREKADDARVYDFFSGLAQAVNGVCAAGAYHADLSGKNIFTKDGRAFCFLDLDGVVLGRPYTREWCMKNHVQLYDSFCDLYDETVLGPFIKAMLPTQYEASSWLHEVREGQQHRRQTHMARL